MNAIGQAKARARASETTSPASPQAIGNTVPNINSAFRDKTQSSIKRLLSSHKSGSREYHCVKKQMKMTKEKKKGRFFLRVGDPTRRHRYEESINLDSGGRAAGGSVLDLDLNVGNGSACPGQIG